jgi:hypothetical protein
MATVEITPLDDATIGGAVEAAALPDRDRRRPGAAAVEDAIRTLKPGRGGEFDVDLPEDARIRRARRSRTGCASS